jgi:hypothetical protein
VAGLAKTKIIKIIRVFEAKEILCFSAYRMVIGIKQRKTGKGQFTWTFPKILFIKKNNIIASIGINNGLIFLDKRNA